MKQGFTLIELMIVVSIIGAIATLSFPSLQQWMATSRSSEAKLALSKVYALQKSFYLENFTYTACIKTIWPSVNPVYYSTGLTNNASNGNICGIKGNEPCRRSVFGGNAFPCATGDEWIPAINSARLSIVQNASDVPSLSSETAMSRTEFKIISIGSVHAQQDLYDAWIIDQDKTLLQKSIAKP